MRVKILRLITTAAAMVERPGSVSTISAEARAASVAPHTAIPTSARLRAGASFTPSPVIPTMRSPWRRASTMRYLCSGNTWANPSAARIMGPNSWPSVLDSSSLGVFTGRFSAPSTLVPMSRRRHISTAIALWSPVIILVTTPNSRHFLMVILVSGRGGSRKVRIPRNTHLLSFTSSKMGPSVLATARERMPRLASSSTLDSTSLQIWSWLWAIRSSTWGAPLVTLKLVPSGPMRVASVRLMVGSKGMNSGCWYASRGVRSMAFSTRVSSASFGGSFQRAASAA
mmetsp:Transcript_25348/g.42481  ORF Transcript_25348/g.42481 Transcript_25348/m.42481 type:complete len:284 (-) Transcript_25348:1388-2239(-)